MEGIQAFGVFCKAKAQDFFCFCGCTVSVAHYIDKDAYVSPIVCLFLTFFLPHLGLCQPPSPPAVVGWRAGTWVVRGVAVWVSGWPAPVRGGGTIFLGPIE